MKKIERILIATDFSISSRAATEVGISLAKQFDSTLTFLHVVIPAPALYSSPSEGALKRRAAERFQLLKARLAQ
ncbi:TPA: universal stress protein [Candidatus Poribacteria bacterium]|nr:universal stress protein [Candidatus Poribacteria bacterium]